MNTSENQPLTESSATPKSWWRRLRRAILVYVFVPYCAVTVIVFVLQRKLMYHPAAAKDLRVATVGLDPDLVRDVQLQTPDGDTIKGWLWKFAGHDSDKQNPLVIYFPGNASNRQGRLNDLREVVAAGYDLLIFDYRGYGDSSGSPSETKLTADAQHIWNYVLNELHYDEQKIVLFGESLGGAVALSLWSTEKENPPQPAALILNSTFTSMPQTVAWHYPFFPFQFLVLDRWPSIDRIGNVHVPIIIFHGTADDIVPVAHGRELAAATTSARFIEITGGGHNGIPMRQLRGELEQLREEMNEK